MNDLLADLRYGFRMLLKTPVVSGVAALSLGLGIAAATAMFAWASAFWLEPLPFGDQDGLVLVRELRHGESIDMAAMASPANFRDWREATTTLADMATMATTRVNVTGLEVPEEIVAAEGTANLFEVLKMRPAMGRAFRPGEGLEGAPDVVVITHQYWERRFDLDPEILGRTLVLDGTPHTIIGVMPDGFEMFPAGVDAFRPVDISGMDERGSKGWTAFGRLREGATLEQARSELTAIQARLETEYPEGNRGWGVLVQNARQWFPGPTDTKLIILMVAVSLFGVAIACANVANLLLSKAETRMKEVAVRTALGAGRMRIFRQLLTESVLLGAVGCAMGVFMSVFLIRGLNTAMPDMLPRAFIPSLDVPTLLTAVGVALFASILFGMAPAIHSVRGELKDGLGEGSRGGTASRGRKRLRNAFVVGQIAVALGLLTGAGELREAMLGLAFADNGFDSEGVLTFQLSIPESKYADAAALRTFDDELLRTLEEVPGVERAASLIGLPRGRMIARGRFAIEGVEYADPNERPLTNWDAVSPGFLETLRIPMVSGRWPGETDREDSPPVVAVNQEFAHRFFPGEEAIGKRIEIQGESREIVGVTQDFQQSRIPFLGRIEPSVFLPAAQMPIRNVAFMVRGQTDVEALAPEIRSAVWSVDPDQPIAAMQTLDDYIEVELAAPRVLGLFVSCLGLLAVFLSALGIYGVMAHSVLQERREIGIRMAVGARAGQLVGMVTKRGMVLSILGLALGIPLALLTHRAVAGALNIFDFQMGYGIVLMAGALLAGVAILASYVPARGAARVHPTRALSPE